DLYRDNKTILIGEGSNLLFVKDFDGLAISIDIMGIKQGQSEGDDVILEVGAGEKWHDLVSFGVDNNYYGMENLALIPGKVGSAAVQNIGAYGAEQKDFCISVQGFDLETGEIKTLSTYECEFSYRNSIFKNSLREKFIVTLVSYKVSCTEKYNLSYKALDQEIDKSHDLRMVFDTVCRVRKSKLPDYNEIGNAGSFFKNPIIKKDLYDKIYSKNPEIQAYDTSGEKIKISAAKLIELAGWKGKRRGNAGVYKEHSLILCNYGKASGQEIYDLSEEIIASVKNKFEVELEREVIVVG
ncbi:MAG: UDP-N-acetylmuramate dehydrogenase, partial [Chlorobi bacterium]|nr:UDP-N-acetylmuramate dehydrogenase [Chlorobiota bacterium]